ncbi:hypothetical protein [Aureispira anguillae]|uniref:Lipoprotein n=1 Tax=Aureispira anguillae TaxID=2864201 RepID=A0A916DQU7_9BACT|nr:hypothetical protein [Aureispira anguillae]BDS09927.1 hypothetical protein AsAng_0006320 [Aureispira anguillae]
MRLKKHVLKAPIFILSFLIFYSCTVTKKQQTKHQKPKGIFVYEAAELREEQYRNIKGAVPRLRAMMCGKFVHQILTKNEEGVIKYETWHTKDGEDSMMIYQVPVGDPHKIGYWIYNCQYLTSLPDNPVYQTFSKLEAVNRDTIKAVSYEVPEGFKLDVTQKTAAFKASLEKIEWKGLKLYNGGSVKYYERQTIIKYNGQSIMKAKELEKHKKIKYVINYSNVEMDRILFGSRYYDKDKKFLGGNNPDQLFKLAGIHPNLY